MKTTSCSLISSHSSFMRALRDARFSVTSPRTSAGATSPARGALTSTMEKSPRFRGKAILDQPPNVVELRAKPPSSYVVVTLGCMRATASDRSARSSYAASRRYKLKERKR